MGWLLWSIVGSVVQAPVDNNCTKCSKTKLTGQTPSCNDLLIASIRNTWEFYFTQRGDNKICLLLNVKH